MAAKCISLSSRVDFYPEQSCLKNKDENIADVYLTPGERKLLEIILEGRGSKENIFYEIWLNQGTVVGESSYHQLIKMLRRKLQSANLSPLVIKTLPRHGLLFIRPDDEEPVARDGLSDSDTAPALPGFEAEQQITEEDGEPQQPEDIVTEEEKIPWYWMWAVCPFLLLLPLLLVVVTGLGSQCFTYSLHANGVVYYATSEHLLQPAYLQDHIGVPGEGIKHIYLADNGPKLWIARCGNEIFKGKSQCSYENISIY